MMLQNASFTLFKFNGKNTESSLWSVGILLFSKLTTNFGVVYPFDDEYGLCLCLMTEYLLGDYAICIDDEYGSNKKAN